MLVQHHPFVLQLREPQHHRLRRGDVAEHTHQQILYELNPPIGLPNCFRSVA